ncbi:hypothetical protein [Salinicoccus sp. HZC-1]|uniref:hypothetical protein n=1 Tax=Salinicoccus sp. HZC-1 TaxID=3385497 RepID=UPI00398B0F67
MKFFLTLISVPLFFTACFGISPDLADEKSSEEDTAKEESAGEPPNEENAPPEVNPINITGDGFVSNFFNGAYEYRTISIRSSYAYMTEILGEPSGQDNIIDGVYYHYDHIGFNFPESRESVDDPGELRVDGIFIFPEDFYKQDAVEHYGWPTEDETSEFRMFYDSDPDNGYYVMMNYNQDDRVTEIILHNKNLSDTKFYTLDEETD